MLSFKLDSGINVYMNHIEMSATYSGLLEGDPAKSNWINDNIVKRLHCPSHWGNRKTYIIHPSEEMMKNYLPPTIYTAWFHSHEHLNPQMDGSELVIIWLDAIPGERKLQEIVEQGVKGVNWQKHAEEFEY